jgi:hypothetical protein
MRVDSPICWLKGPAGSGKSAISQSIAERYAATYSLAASFFFFRGAGDRSKITRFIPTLAYQLSLSIPATKPWIQRVLRDEPSIVTDRSLRYQFKKLITEPFLVAKTPDPPLMPLTKRMVIVVDALDECDDRDLMAEFIDALIDAFQGNHGLYLQFLVTSRFEEHIRKKLETYAACAVVDCLSLSDFDARIDIRNFFRSRFSMVRQENARLMKNVSLPWPSESDLDTLVRKADGLFIFAVTLMGFIDQGHGLPQEKLQKALAAESGLDELYKQVLSNAPRDHNFGRVIGTIMLLSYPLSVMLLAQLLRLRPEDIVVTLLGTQSIIMIPEADDKDIRLLHTSLRDLLISQPRSGEFYINPSTRHWSITADCLTLIVIRPENDIFHGGVQRYASLNWCYHLRQSSINERDDILEPLHSLTQDFSFDFWINTLLLEGSNGALNDLDLMLSQSTNYPNDLVQVIKGIRERAKLDINVCTSVLVLR